MREIRARGYVGQFKISTSLKKDKGLKGLGTICTWHSMARAELCSTAGSHGDHRRKLWFWSLSNFHNVFHFGSWGLCVIWVLQCLGLLRRDPPVWEQQEETQPSPPAPESARQGSELSLHCIMRPKLCISWAELKTAAARPDTHLRAVGRGFHPLPGSGPWPRSVRRRSCMKGSRLVLFSFCRGPVAAR